LQGFKWIFAIFYHPIMILFILLTFLLPLLIFGQWNMALDSGIPSDINWLAFLSIIAFWVYLAMRSRFLGKLYRKITILLPFMQMLLYTGIGLAIGQIFIDQWAEREAYSKDGAALLALLSFAAVRLLMSLFYWKFPLAHPKAEHQPVEKG